MSSKNKLVYFEEISSDVAQWEKVLTLFDQLDERGKITTLALLETAVKLHPKEPA